MSHQVPLTNGMLLFRTKGRHFEEGVSGERLYSPAFSASM